MVRINGQDINIAINPRGNKDLDDEEIFVPHHLDIRNGFLSDAGHWIKRPGASELYDTATKYPINLLIDRDSGYVGNANGELFKIESGGVTALGGARYGTERPTWDEFGDRKIICAGTDTVKIQNDTVTILEDIPIGVKYITRIGPHTVYAGHDDNTLLISPSLNPESVDVGAGGAFVLTQQRGGKIRNIKEVGDKVFAFMDRQIEIWVNIGGATILAKQDGLTINSGTPASHSVVEANDTFYFYGDDNKFYAITGQGAKDISKSYTKDIDEIVNPDKMYGIHYKKERLIRWFEPVQGKCYVYDYVHDVFSEDNTWDHGQFERMTHNSYMELKNRAYYGDYDPTGKVFEWSRDYKDDDGKPIRVFRQFAIKPSQRGNKVRFNRLKFRVKRGVGNHGETPVICYRYKIDKQDWSVERTVDLGAKGDYDTVIRAQGTLGTGREIEFQITVTDSVDYTLTDMLLNVRELEV